MKRLTIFILLPSFASGGAERVTISLIENMDKSNFNYFLVMQNTYGPLKCNIANNKIINLNALKFRYALINLVKVIYKKKPKVIFSTFPHMTIFLLIIKKIFFPQMTIIAREPNMPSISLLHTSNSYIIRNLYNNFMPSIDGVIASSSSMKNELLNKGIIAKKIAIISNPINTKKIRNIKKVNRFGGKGLRLVFVGRLVYQKGLDRLIPILKNIKNIHLTIIGEGTERSHLEKIIKKHKISDKISFLGHLDSPYAYMAGADYFVLPSRWEGLPNVVLESLALGTPVITMKAISGLEDLKYNILKNDLLLCKKIEDMADLILKLCERKDHKNPILRNPLIKNYNSQSQYSKKVSNFIEKIFYENRTN